MGGAWALVVFLAACAQRLVRGRCRACATGSAGPGVRAKLGGGVRNWLCKGGGGARNGLCAGGGGCAQRVVRQGGVRNSLCLARGVCATAGRTVCATACHAKKGTHEL